MKKALSLAAAAALLFAGAATYWRAHAGTAGSPGARRSALAKQSGGQEGPEASDARRAADAGARSATVPGVEPEQSAGGQAYPASPARAAPSRRLAESLLVSDKGLDMVEIQHQVDSGQFETLLDRMTRESDADTLEMTRIYRGALDAKLARQENFVLRKLICGAQSCAAILSAKELSETKFDETVMQAQGGVRIYSAFSSATQEPDASGMYTYSVVFTTDPRLNFIAVPTK